MGALFYYLNVDVVKTPSKIYLVQKSAYNGALTLNIKVSIFMKRKAISWALFYLLHGDIKW